MDNEFLKDEDSIFSGVLNNFSHQRTHFIMDTMRFTNFNFLGFFSDNIPLSFVNYLDPSIEDFRIIVNEKKKLDPHFGITFANSEEEIKVSRRSPNGCASDIQKTRQETSNNIVFSFMKLSLKTTYVCLL